MPINATEPYDEGNIFARILRGEIPCNKVHEDEHSLAFHDINKQAPVHILVIPKGAYVSWDDFSERGSDEEIAGFVRAVGRVAREAGLVAPGYRLLANAGLKRLSLSLARVPPGRESFIYHSHERDEEFVYILSGAVDVYFEDGKVVHLARGDSLYFDSRIGHAYVSVSRQLAKIVGMTTTESGHMTSAREAPASRPAGKARPQPKPKSRPAATTKKIARGRAG